MNRIITLVMSLALIFVFSVPAAFAQQDTEQCLKNCEVQIDVCKKSCQGDQACEKECAAQEEQCKASCK